MENKRSTYVVSKALRNFVMASVLTSAAGQLASTMDAIALAQFEGEEAVSALSLVMPVTTFISCLGLLMAFGANALIARAIGQHDLERASRIFSTAVWAILTIGVLFSLLMYVGIPVIMDMVTDEEALRALPAEYLSVYVLGAWLEMLSYALCLFVATDGHPRRVTVAVFVGMLVNVMVDVLTVGFLEWGVQGVAWGSLAQFAVNILLLGLYLRQSSYTYCLQWPGRRGWQYFVENVKEGASVTISNILMAATVLLVSNICYNALGERGLFFWSVCLQMLLLAVVFINGVMEALFAIGGVLLGEHDLHGLNQLSRQALVMVSVLVAVIVCLMYTPDVIGVMFGIEDAQEMADLNHVMRVFSLMLLPFALTLILVAIYQILDRIALSVMVVVGQLATIVLTAWGFAEFAPSYVWWSFPLAAFCFLSAQLLYSYAYSRRQKCRVSGLTLIPYSEGGRTFDRSVRYKSDEVFTVLHEMDAFLKDTPLSRETVFRLNLCSEELMTNIAQHSQGHVVHHSFDVHIFYSNGSACIALKDGGRPFNPLQTDRADKLVADGEVFENLGLRLINQMDLDISYKYMYGLNIVLINV